MEGIIGLFYYFSISPIGWIFYSGLFFWFIIKKSEPAKTILYLKCYCILVMPLALEALIRSMIYVYVIHGNLDASTILSFLIVSILVLCYCVFTLSTKFASFVKYNIYISFTLILIAMIVTFPIVSLKSEVTYQILAVWGCIATALYALSQYTAVSEIAMSEKVRIFKNMIRICVLLTILIPLALFRLFSQEYSAHTFITEYYLSYFRNVRAIRPDAFFEIEAFSESSPKETVNVIERLEHMTLDEAESESLNLLSEHKRVVTVVLKNKTYSYQYNAEAWFYLNRGVPRLGFGAYSGKSFEDYKKDLAGSKVLIYNSSDLDSPYDGIGSIFYREIFKLK